MVDPENSVPIVQQGMSLAKKQSVEHVEINLETLLRIFDVLSIMQTDASKKLEYLELMGQRATMDQLRRTILVPAN